MAEGLAVAVAGDSVVVAEDSVVSGAVGSEVAEQLGVGENLILWSEDEVEQV